MLKVLIKNQKGAQLVEVLIALFLAGFFISGLNGFYQYTGDFQKVKDFTSAERHWTLIQNIFSQNCDSFAGDTLSYSAYVNHNPINGQDPGIPQITMKESEPPYEHKLLYAKSDIAGHSLSDPSNISIKNIALEKVTDEYALLKITFESLKTFEEYEKVSRIYINTDSSHKLIDCSLKPILPCVEQDIRIDYIWEERDSSGSKKYKCFANNKRLAGGPQLRKLASGWLKGGSALPGEIVSITDTSSPCCICMIQLQCSEGFWSQSTDCFKRKGSCVSCPPGEKWDSFLTSCVPILPVCNGGQVLDFSTKTCKCPLGTNWDGSNCVTCFGGQIWDPKLEICKCPSSKPHWTGSQCIKCVGGQLFDSNSKTCRCPSGQTWDGSQCVTPSSCPSGQTWDAINKVCV